MSSTTRGDLKTALKSRLDESDYNYWNEARFNTLLNKAHRRVAQDTGIIEKTFYASVTSGIREYAFPTNYIDSLQVQWKKEPVTMVETTWLDTYDTDWRETSGSSLEYATVENGNLSLYPIPNAAAAAETNPLRLKCRVYPDDFTDDSGTIEIPDYMVEILLDVAEALAWESYDKAKAQLKYADYERGLGLYIKRGKSPEGPRAELHARHLDRRTYRSNY